MAASEASNISLLIFKLPEFKLPKLLIFYKLVYNARNEFSAELVLAIKSSETVIVLSAICISFLSIFFNIVFFAKNKIKPSI
jgi:hypothetical protein